MANEQRCLPPRFRLRMFGFAIDGYASEKRPRWAKDPGRCGYWDPNFDPPRLWVCTMWPWEEQRRTLLHELGHQILHSMRFQSGTEEEEDTFILALERCLDALLAENDCLLRWYLPEEGGA